MINVAEKLKDCPKGTKLYSPLFGEVEFVRIRIRSIIVKVLDNRIPYSNVPFTAEGKWHNIEQSECMLFPSKDNRDWNKFDYSIKPKYRPFANAQECIEEMKKHQPFGWLKPVNKCTNKAKAINISSIGCDDEYPIQFANDYGDYSFEYLYKEFTFMDGTPFGILEEE